ncbi:MAG: tRNA (guanosine(37)-N1)-methyltransferase TrmD [Candidatus Babeliaceae bacterium]|nr:tRNA (guanosine(37)-N1)-methyltransferase TrmD [Candidatus Babeliaceae bacterium]
MKISVVSLFPELYEPFRATSLVQRAQDAGLLSVDVRSLFSFCAPKERADGPIFGHGPGMVLRPEVIERAVDASEEIHGPAFKIFFSPHGTALDQPLLENLYARIAERGGHSLLLPARYEGVDARVEEEYADAVISVGDFVLLGGDLPAMMLIEGIIRLIPGVVGKAESVECESFAGPFVDFPHYTAPVIWKRREVPEVLRSGDHAAQEKWRLKQAIDRTVKHHFSWVRSHETNPKERREVLRAIPPHYAALMHTGVLVQQGVEGESSVTSIDIHDIARSSRTFGMKNYFIVTPLIDQQKIVDKLLGFWQAGEGVSYNPLRHEAVSLARLAKSLDEVVAMIEEQEGKKPLLIATSAKSGVAQLPVITYDSQETVWQQDRPVLFLFGTAQGLGDSILARCDYLLPPIEGFAPYNHLSVRSAAALIFDRWLGISIKRRNLL